MNECITVVHPVKNWFPCMLLHFLSPMKNKSETFPFPLVWRNEMKSTFKCVLKSCKEDHGIMVLPAGDWNESHVLYKGFWDIWRQVINPYNGHLCCFGRKIVCIYFLHVAFNISKDQFCVLSVYLTVAKKIMASWFYQQEIETNLMSSTCE